MSKRRKIGDRVWIVPGAGFGASRGEWGTIIDCESNREEDHFHCSFCADKDCREWSDVRLDSGRMAYHVSECQMLDEPPLHS